VNITILWSCPTAQVRLHPLIIFSHDFYEKAKEIQKPNQVFLENPTQTELELDDGFGDPTIPLCEGWFAVLLFFLPSIRKYYLIKIKLLARCGPRKENDCGQTINFWMGSFWLKIPE
jgi:hypothetical protein